MAKLNKFFFTTKLSIIQRISLAGLFIALAMILQKVVAINYIPVIPFVRISFGGCAVIILSSILLGPWFGLLVGAATDLLGYLIFDPRTMGLFPQITAIYALLGFSGYFAFALVRYLSNKKASMMILYSSFLAGVLATALTFAFNSSIKLFSTTYNLELWQRITIPFIMLALSLLTALFITLFDKHFTKKDVKLPFNVYQIAIASLLLEVVVMTIFGSLMKGWAFSFKTFPIILFSQVIVGFINMFLNTTIISYIILVARRYFENV